MLKGSIPPLLLATKYEAGLKEQMMIGTLKKNPMKDQQTPCPRYLWQIMPYQKVI
jgi:hypothetical protein